MMWFAVQFRLESHPLIRKLLKQKHILKSPHQRHKFQRYLNPPRYVRIGCCHLRSLFVDYWQSLHLNDHDLDKCSLLCQMSVHYRNFLVWDYEVQFSPHFWTMRQLWWVRIHPNIIMRIVPPDGMCETLPCFEHRFLISTLSSLVSLHLWKLDG